ncbi:MAG: hypothetical protein IKX26_03375 [Bacteroidales bacterium]|nr:hypothetical protein [Bacteroidales bacterium]
MKNETVLKLLFLLLGVFPVTVVESYAQLALVNEPDKPSVQAAEMTKYGKLNAQLYTGKVSVSIPIYVYRDSRFSIPISLDYSYNGLVANRQAGIAGLGWSLSCGGVITREVRGIPDELLGSFNKHTSSDVITLNLLGFDYIPSGSQLQMPEYEVITRPSSSNVLKTAYSINGTLYETCSDIYHFSFPGHSGSFYRNPDGSFTVFHTGTFDGDYRIKKTNITLNDENHNVATEFVITTSDGYRYYFGSLQSEGDSGLFRYIERSVYQGYDKGNPDATPKPYRAISFLLRRIESQDGSAVTFNYNENDSHSDIVNYSSTLWLCSQSSDDAFSMLQYGEDLNTASYLSSIELPGGTSLDFSYLAKPTGKQGSYLQGTDRLNIRLDQSYLLLDSISTPAGGVRLSYIYNSQGNPYPFLSEIHQEGIGSYRFDYEGLYDRFFPAFGTTATDHWGYICKSDSSHMNRNSVDLDYLSNTSSSTFDETVSTSRNANTTASSIGLMTRITYPTGGSSILQYEDNTVWRNLRKLSSNGYSPAMYSSGGGFLDKGPGSRISKVINVDENGVPTDTTSYVYRRENYATSGSLLVYPRYRLDYTGVMGNTDVVHVNIASSSGIANYEATPVEYSRVEEIHPDGSKTVHHFSGWDDCPDEFSSEAYELFRAHSGEHGNSVSPMFISGKTTLTSSGADAVHNILRPATSHQSRRGKEKMTETYSAEGQLLRKTETDYLVMEEQNAFYENIYIGEAVCPLMRYTYDTKTQKVKGTDFFQNNSSVSSQVQYTYNSLGQKSSEVKTLSNGDIITTNYTYIPDIADNHRTAVQKKMYSKGLIGNPVKVTVKCRLHGTTIDRVMSSDSLTFDSLARTGATTLFLPKKWQKRDVETGTWKDYASYVHDSKGNIIQKTDANGISTTFIWYSDNLGVALRIDNATAAQVTAALGSSPFGGMAEANTESIATTLRSALPHSEVSWYKWWSYGLPSKVCDPTGRITHYTYDTAQRLNIIRDDSLDPVERYDNQTLTR